MAKDFAGTVRSMDTITQIVIYKDGVYSVISVKKLVNASLTCLLCHPQPQNSNRGAERSGVDCEEKLE